jgi:hypothetical protein
MESLGCRKKVWLSTIRPEVGWLDSLSWTLLCLVQAADPCRFETSLLLQYHVRYPRSRSRSAAFFSGGSALRSMIAQK